MLLPSDYYDFKWLFVPLAIFIRYLLNALLLFALFYGFKRRQWLYRKIQQSFPQKKDYGREIGYSAITSLIFAVFVWLCLGTPLRDYTLFYRGIDQHGIGWLIMSVPLSLLVHDTRFYWIHRLMHNQYRVNYR